jgi:uncharacterized LabA/DUF88 family protein
MSDRVAIFIDGGYLDKVLQKEFKFARIKYQKLSDWMSKGMSIFRTYYYNCLPYQGSPPTEDEKDRFSRAQKFHYSLRKLPHYEVREGKLEHRGYDKDGVPIFVQKRVDILLGVDLVLLSTKLRITHASIFTGDSDFLPAIRVAKNEGVLINLFHSQLFLPHDDLWQIADDRFVITEDVINKITR